MVYWGNLTSLRFWFGTILGALVIGFVVSLFWAPGGYAAFFVLLPLLMYGALLSPLRCPHCRKRVTSGASVCGHCGHEVG